MNPLVHADFSLGACVDSSALPWVGSAATPQVCRRALDRVGGEVARATTVVRYLPGARFPSHTHAGGEEFLVLRGEFADEHGSYPSGWYVRNPIGSSHAPWSHERDGCDLLVKLRQMWDPAERPLRINTFAADAAWQRVADSEGAVERLALFAGHPAGAAAKATERVWIDRLGCGASLRAVVPPGGLEMFVVDGAVTSSADGGKVAHGAGTWFRVPAADAGVLLRVECAGAAAARLWCKSGHLDEATLAACGYELRPPPAS